MHDHTTGPLTGPHPMTPTALARALAERAESVCRHYLPHGHLEGRYWLAGDIHGAPGRALWVCLAPPGHPGRWTDNTTGAKGNLLELIARQRRDPTPERAIAEACAFLAGTGHAAPTARPAPPEQELCRRAEAALRLWALCRSIHGSHAEAYLLARGLERCRDHRSLRFHPELFYRNANDAPDALPALVAAVSSPTGSLTGVQRTYLDPHRPAKADIPNPRKALGPIHRGAVYFGQPRHHTLIVAQGIETALALHTACPALAVAATLTEANLGAFAAPAACQRLLIAPNHDTTSAHAAERLLARCRSPQVSVAVIAPVGHDFNDDLLAHGREALAARIHHAAGRLHFANRETTPAPTTPSPASHQGRLP